MATNPFEKEPKSKPDTKGTLDDYKSWLANQSQEGPQEQESVSEVLSPEEKNNRENAITKAESEQMQQARLAAEKAFNPDPQM